MDLSSHWQIERFHPYIGKCTGVGRWFDAITASGNKMGYVWTNDDDGFGILTTDQEYSSQEFMEWFLHCQLVWGQNKTPAKTAFESYYRMQFSWAGETQITKGDLDQTLSKELVGSMDEEVFSYTEYGVTSDDNGRILELVLVDGSGLYYREAQSWEEVGPDSVEEDYPTIFNQQWDRVDESVVDLYDESEELSLTDIEIYTL